MPACNLIIDLDIIKEILILIRIIRNYTYSNIIKEMKRKIQKASLICFLFLFFFFNSTLPVKGAGQYCCDPSYYYQYPSQCLLMNQPPHPVPPGQYHCFSNELCLSISSSKNRGICSEDVNTVKCCDSSFNYNPKTDTDSAPCKASQPYVPPRGWNCSSGQFCSNGYCVSGQKTEEQKINLLKPQTCKSGFTYEPIDPAQPGLGAKDDGIQTALGCFPTRAKGILAWIMKYAIVFAGSSGSFLMMFVGAFQIIFSAGNPEKLKQGWQILISAISGLMLIIFAVFLFRLIGFTILRIPGFG